VNTHLKIEFFSDITRYRPKQPVYEIKLMLSRVLWALAQISCLVTYELFCNIHILFSSLPLPCTWSAIAWLQLLHILMFNK